MFGAQLELKREVALTLAELSALAREVGSETLAQKLDADRKRRLEDEKFHLVIVGEFNRGKSSIINALLGVNVLPVGILPTTSALTLISEAPAPRVDLCQRDGSRRALTWEEFAALVVDPGEEGQLSKLEVGYPAELLKGGVVLVDTPGTNDLDAHRAEITYGYLPSADAVLLCLDATQVLTASERAFLEERLLERTRERLVFVLAKADLLSRKEAEETLRFAREHLGQLVADPPIFLVSAKRALGGEAEVGPDPDRSPLEGGSGMAILRRYLEQLLGRGRYRLLLDAAARDGRRAAQALRSTLLLKRRGLSLEVDELERRVLKARAQLAERGRITDLALSRIREEAGAIRATIAHDLDLFKRAFERALPIEVEGADATELRRHLGPFIEDRFRVFCDQEGEKIAVLLERLAEEIITLANEEAREASKALGEALGPLGADVHIEVDTFKYDLGVFALGALGTTVALFVNFAIGGALTLAAPILAFALQGRVAQAVREDAKKRGVRAIQQAAEAVGPRLISLVDDFAARLSAFVTAAGESLHRSVSEVLDRALEERRRAGAAVDQAIAAAESQIEAASQLDRKLEGLEGRIWFEGLAEGVEAEGSGGPSGPRSGPGEDDDPAIPQAETHFP